MSQEVSLSESRDSLPPPNEKKRGGLAPDLELDGATTIDEGEQKYNRLGWKRLTICLIVEAIALGSLSIPSAFAKVGMVPGIILTIGLGLVAIYTSYVIGQVKLKFPQVEHYADAVGLLWGRFGYELTGVMFAVFLILITGSHTLTGTIAFINIIDEPAYCALIWGIISAIILFALALPPSFTEFAILGYIDFVSIVVAILITIVATGVNAHSAPGGLAAVNWSVWAPGDVSFTDAFLATSNIIFAYSFSVCQFSFMAEMHTPKDYVKSIWSLGLIEMFIYTVTGALIYAFVGHDVKSPALLSAGPLISRVAFGVALPVIFISGSINSTVVGRYIVGRAFKTSSIRYTNTKLGWLVWIAIIAAVTVVSWIIAELIPFFSSFLGLISSLFISGFSYYFPALFWFGLIKEGKWYRGWKNISLSMINASVLVMGLVLLGVGTWSTIADIISQYSVGLRSPFSCDSSGYE